MPERRLIDVTLSRTVVGVRLQLWRVTVAQVTERKLLWVVGAGYFFAFFDIVTISFAAP